MMFGSENHSHLHYLEALLQAESLKRFHVLIPKT